MRQTNRVTVEQIKEAYARTGYQPVRGEWLHWLNDQYYACPLLACADASVRQDPRQKDDEELDAERFVAEALGLSDAYIGAFTITLDETHPDDVLDPEAHPETFAERVAWKALCIAEYNGYSLEEERIQVAWGVEDALRVRAAMPVPHIAELVASPE